MGRVFNIPWVRCQNTMSTGLNIPWIGGVRYTMPLNTICGGIMVGFPVVARQ